MAALAVVGCSSPQPVDHAEPGVRPPSATSTRPDAHHITRVTSPMSFRGGQVRLTPPASAPSLTVDHGLIGEKLRKFDDGLSAEGLEPQLLYGDWTDLVYGHVDLASAAEFGFTKARNDLEFEQHPMVVARFASVPTSIMRRFARGGDLSNGEGPPGEVLVLFDAATGEYFGTQLV